MGKLREDSLYLGDNGRCFCGRDECSGTTASCTGHDISGLLIIRITADEVKAAGMISDSFKCETCGRGFSDFAKTKGL
jgi:predicted NBD/HSP70 family sugar kinase